MLREHRESPPLRGSRKLVRKVIDSDPSWVVCGGGVEFESLEEAQQGTRHLQNPACIRAGLDQFRWLFVARAAGGVWAEKAGKVSRAAKCMEGFGGHAWCCGLSPMEGSCAGNLVLSVVVRWWDF